MKSSRRNFLTSSAAFATMALFQIHPSIARAQQAYSENTALRYIPFSTSYLSLRDGDFVRKNLGGGLSLAQKFDRAGQSLYGAQWLNFQALYASFHRPNAQSFEGKCHQWAAGAHDIALQNLITQTGGGLQCGSVTLSIPELRELVTAFYTPATRRVDFGTQPQRTEQMRFIRNEMGMDAIPALTFHSEIHRSLRAGEGVVIDIGPEGQIWNYPVFRMESTLSRISPSQHRGVPLPPTVFSDSSVRAEYEQTYNLLKTYAARTDELQDMDMNTTRAYVARAKALFEQLQATPVAGLDVFNVRSVVQHAGVSRFASGSQETKRKVFEYILVARRSGGGFEYIDGAWINPVSDQAGLSHFFSSDDGRPARVWFPAPLTSLEAVDNLLIPGQMNPEQTELVTPERPALQALVTMLRRCKPVRQ